MSNSKQQNKHQSSSPEEDAIREERNQSRVNRAHGGNLVEAISEEELFPVNDANCEHENMTRDETETEFNAFKCDNPNCGVVVLYEKVI